MTKKFDFIGKRFVFFAISIVLMIAGIVAYFINGITWDIDFKGGTKIDFNLTETYDNNEMQNFVKDQIGQTPVIQKTGADGKGAAISTNVLSNEDSDKLVSALKEKYTNMSGEPQIQNIQPAFGKELVNAALKGVIAAVVLILIYIIARFRILGFKAGLAAILALLHDVLIMISVYIIFKIPVNSVFVAAVLTIIGYSINNTIIIYDRIRENRRGRRNLDVKDAINMSINQTMTRSVYTTLTVVMCVGAILVLSIIYNQQLLVDFSLPLMIGLICGAYSSICISSELWYVFMGKNKDKIDGKKENKKENS